MTASAPPTTDAVIWVQLVPAGTFSARDGRGPFHAGSGTALQGIIDQSLKIAGRTELVIDYDHQTVFGAKDGVGGTARAAGWIKQLEARADGIFGRVVWTAAAAEAIKAGEYRYLSPVLMQSRATGKVQAIRMASLTNTPALDMLEVAASTTLPGGSEVGVIEIAASTTLPASAFAALSVPLYEEDPMSDTPPLADLAGRLGLDADATAEAASAKLEELLVLAKTAGVAIASLSARPSGDTVPLSVFQDTVAELNKLRQGTTQKEAERLVSRRIEAGQLMPFMREWAIGLCTTNLPQFEAFCDKIGPAAKAIIEPQFKEGKLPRQGTSATQLTNTELAICSNMGLTPEQFVAMRASLEAGEDRL